jgi:hypothetical protein
MSDRFDQRAAEICRLHGILPVEDESGWPHAVCASIAKALRKEGAAVEALRGLEWMGTPEHGEPTCPACSQPKTAGHWFDCPTSAVLDPLVARERCARCGKPEQHVNHYDGGHLFAAPEETL